MCMEDARTQNNHQPMADKCSEDTESLKYAHSIDFAINTTCNTQKMYEN